MTPNPAASVRARLLARARVEGEEFERTLVRYAGERFLYRLGQSKARESCLLKGATLLSIWMARPHRATRDVDLLNLMESDEASVRQMLEEVCSEECPEDGLRFDLSRMSLTPIRADEEFVGQRARFLAFLGSARIRVQVDLGIGDVVAAHEEVELPLLIENLPPPRVRAYPRIATVAEKFEAMLKLDIRNSRMKDFHDLWALSQSFAFDGPALRSAIEACFERRRLPRAPETPTPLTSAFYERDEMTIRWGAYLRSGVLLERPPTRFGEIGEQVIRFLGPLRESIVHDATFDRRWPPGGPWQEGDGRAPGDV